MKNEYQYKPEFIEKLNRCSMPNLAAEIHFRCGGHFDTYAEYANITKELLKAFLSGAAEITVQEFLAMARLNGSHIDYLTSKKLGVYTLSNRMDVHKVKRMLGLCKERLSVCDPECIDVKYGLVRLNSLSEMNGIILRADINALLQNVQMAELDLECKREKDKKRGLRKKITAPDGNPEAVNSQG